VHPDLPSPPEADGSLDVVCAEMLDFHARFAHQRDGYQPATRQLLEYGEAHPLDAVAYFRLQQARLDDTRSWLGWLDAADADLLVEPTVPVVAPLRGAGHQDMTNDADLLALTALWNWTGMPVVSLPAGLGSRSGLPVGVSLVGRPGDDWRLLDLGVALEQALAEG
jgi:Asp-tRNA(Asn)/Glu-tRNA(Gln) amidotransferase A subunit family amidase